MAEFTELNRSLVKLRNVGNITTVLDLFSENNTSYAVYEYIEGVKLVDYLKDNMGELSWEETAKLFPPLLTTISLLHKAGIVHRAISPDTIYYTSRNELRLTDFCISAVRTKDTELRDELYKGYSAPEQYSINGKQGTWTDVYGISAVLYKVLTGCMPTEAITRIEHDNLCSLTDINLDIPESVSNAIMKGMSIDIDKRIKNVTDLVTEIFDKLEKNDSFSSTIKIPRTLVNEKGSNAEDTTPVPTPSTETTTTEEQDADSPSGTLFDKIKFPLMIGLLLLAIILILGIVLVNMFSSSDNDSQSMLQHTNEYSSDETSATNVVEITSVQPSITYMMKNFVGKDIDDVTSDEEIKDKLNFDIEYVYSDEYGVDKVVEQSIEMGDSYTEGDTVVLKVSKGPKTAEVPDYKTGSMSCYTKEDYIKLLESKGIPYELVAVVNWGYYSGYVIGTEPSAGEVLDIEAGDVLKVTYTDNPSSKEDTTTRYVVSTTEAQAEEQTVAQTNSWSYDDSDDDDSYTTANYTSNKSSSNYNSNSSSGNNYTNNNGYTYTYKQTQAPTYTYSPTTEAPVQQQTQAPTQNDYSNDNNYGGNDNANDGGNDNYNYVEDNPVADDNAQE
jgi:serine/threonine-protein kinase